MRSSYVNLIHCYGSGWTRFSMARFSFTFQTYDRKSWAIKTHHSSLLPNAPGGTRRNLRVG